MMASKIYGAILERFKFSKKSFMQMALHILMLSAMLLFFKLNIVTIIIWTLLNAFFQVYVTNPTLSIFYALTSRGQRRQRIKTEAFCDKELFSVLGRCSGTLLYFWLLQGYNI